MKQTLSLLAIAILAAAASGCHVLRYTITKPDGTKTEFAAKSLFSNSAVRGLTVDGTTKTTTQGLRITAGATEPNAEAITASASALGELIGSAAASAVKP